MTGVTAAPTALVEQVELPDFELYRALPLSYGQTRLIRLMNSSHDAKLEGDLIVVSNDISGGACLASTQERVAFSALSYTWGTGASCGKVMLNGYSQDIKENLADFLYQFRATIATGAYAYLWVDAVCINQQDEEEKAHQVSNMRTFYSAAERVIVWLGKEGRYTAQAVEFLRKAERESATGSSLLREKDVQILYDSGSIHGLVDIYSRPWSTRIWIKQEVWAAQHVTVWCGRYNWRPFAWVSFAAGFFLADEGNLLITKMFTLGLDRRKINALVGLEWSVPMDEPQGPDFTGQRGRDTLPAKIDILNLLRGSASSESSDARDRIYALLNMSNTQPTDFQVSYTITTEEVYTNFARYIANREGCVGALLGLDVLFGTSGGLALPSWVPDWRYLTDGPPKGSILNKATIETAVDGPVSLQSQGNTLVLRGVTLRHGRDLIDFPVSTDIKPDPLDICRLVACYGCGLPILLRAADQVNQTSYTFVGLVPLQDPIGIGKDALSPTTWSYPDAVSRLNKLERCHELETFNII